jgi:hypothetical protein
VYGNRGEQRVEVPPGLDGKIWHLRMGPAGANVISRHHQPPRYPYPNVVLDLKGVPGYLAPTWEQWFDPQNPTPALERE